MRVLLVNYMETTSPGGINKAVREIAKNLSNHEIIILQLNPLNLPEEEYYEGFKIIRIKTKWGVYGLSYEMYDYLRKHFNKLNPDIVHVHGYHSLLSLEVINIIKNLNHTIPIIFSPYIDVERSTIAGKYLWKLYNFLNNGTFKKCSHTIASSKFEAQKIIELFNVDPNNLSIIPLGVNKIDIKINDMKRKKLNLLYYGYLVKRKGVDFLLKSLKSLVYDFGVTDVILKIIGEGKDSKKLLKLADDLKINDYIEWKPFLPRNQLINEIRCSDIVLLLSRSEAYGINVAETLALGIPCIITKHTALNEFIDEVGCFGVDYPPDPDKVAELIIDIYKKEVKVGPFTDKIRTWGKVIEDYERLYEELLLNK